MADAHRPATTLIPPIRPNILLWLHSMTNTHTELRLVGIKCVWVYVRVFACVCLRGCACACVCFRCVCVWWRPHLNIFMCAYICLYEYIQDWTRCRYTSKYVCVCTYTRHNLQFFTLKSFNKIITWLNLSPPPDRLKDQNELGFRFG